MARVTLRGLNAIDRRTAAARALLAWRSEVIGALGGEDALSPQQKTLIDLAARAKALLDHVDAWLFEQPSLVNRRSRTLLPVLIQRQGIANDLAKLLDQLGCDRVPAKNRHAAQNRHVQLAARYAVRSPEQRKAEITRLMAMAGIGNGNDLTTRNSS